MALKTQLLNQLEALSTQTALLPFHTEVSNHLIKQLEQCNPIPNTLYPDAPPQLLEH